MTDTDRTLPDVIDATTLAADEVERRRRHDELVYGNSFVFRHMGEGRTTVDGVEAGVDLGLVRDRTGVVIVTGKLNSADGVRRMMELMDKFGRGVSLSVRLPAREIGAVDALALKPRTDDLGPPATQGALTPAKLTPAEARVARKLAGPWHDDQPWKHRKKGGRR